MNFNVLNIAPITKIKLVIATMRKMEADKDKTKNKCRYIFQIEIFWNLLTTVLDSLQIFTSEHQIIFLGPLMVAQSGSVRYPIMGKTADLTDVHLTVTDTFCKATKCICYTINQMKANAAFSVWIMKIKHTIVVRVKSVSWRIWWVNGLMTYGWCRHTVPLHHTLVLVLVSCEYCPLTDHTWMRMQRLCTGRVPIKD